MKIGILMKHLPTGGGVFQYFLTIIDSLLQILPAKNLFLYYCEPTDVLAHYQHCGIRSFNLSEKIQNSQDIIEHPKQYVIFKGKKVLFRTPPVTQTLKTLSADHGIDLMIYPIPERESFEVEIPYIMAIHDFAHKTLPQFPEFTADGILEQREYVYSEGIKNASTLLIESETGKNQLLSFYPVDPGKIAVLPYVPPAYLHKPNDIYQTIGYKIKLHLPDRFIFYPAQFWPHKNHENLIKAISLIKEESGEKIHAVFTGDKRAAWGHFAYIKRMIQELKLEDQITYLGYVNADRMYDLFRMAEVLVMPTFLGPSNFPIIEAFTLQCPVITSDIPGAFEQAGKAAILVDPNKPDQIGKAIYQVWTNAALREELIRKGSARVLQWTHSHFCKRLEKVIVALKQSMQIDYKSAASGFLMGTPNILWLSGFEF